MQVPRKGWSSWVCTRGVPIPLAKLLASQDHLGQWLTSTGLLYSYHIANLQGELGGPTPLEVVYGCEMKESGTVRPLDTKNLCIFLSWLYLMPMKPSRAEQNQHTNHFLPQESVQAQSGTQRPLLICQTQPLPSQALRPSLVIGRVVMSSPKLDFARTPTLPSPCSMLTAILWGVNCDPISPMRKWRC